MPTTKTPTVKQLLVKTEQQYAEIIRILTNDTPPPTLTSEFYIPETQASRWAKENPNHPHVGLIRKIAQQPTGIWLGEWSGNVWQAVTDHMNKAAGKLAVFVAYNIPGRDNGNYSAGGLHSAREYYSWIGSIGAAIGQGKAWIILEPDAIALSTDLDEIKRRERLEMIHIAIDILKKQPNVRIFLDASMWKNPDEMVMLLRQAGIDNAYGFSLNVSGYKRTDECMSYGNKLSGILGGKHFVIDTSRNGNGEWDWQKDNPGKTFEEVKPWCNPPRRAIGVVPTLQMGNPFCDAFLWVKNIGESDGTCRGYPPAGTFVPQLAIEMAKNAGWS